MDPKILELLERLAELTAEQLGELEEVLVADAKTAAEEKNVSLLEEVVAALDKVRDRQQELVAEAEAADARVAELLSKVEPAAENPDPENPDPAEPPADPENPDAPPEPSPEDPPAEPTAEETPAIAAGARKPLPNIAAIRARVPKSQTAKPKQERRAILVAGSDIAGLSAGQEVTDREQLIRAVQNRWAAISSGRNDAKFIVATIKPDYPDERVLRRDGSDMAKIKAVVGEEALVASGGLCAPAEVRYDVPVFAETGMRPIRDSLPGFNAGRGALSFRRAFELSDFDAATAIHTVTNDENGDTKAVQIVQCPTDPVTVQIQAITNITQFGNLNARTDPEGVEAAMETAQANWERLAESTLYTAMVNAATAVTTSEQLSAYRDVIFNLGKLAAQYRSHYRLRDDARFRWLAPAWVANLLQVDLAQQMPGDNTRAVSRQEIENELGVYGIDPVWSPDISVYGTQGAGVTIAWNTSFQSLLYPEGTYLFLDGGELNLGVVRDSTLNNTNDFQNFYESFENVARVGNQALAITMDVCPNGLSAGQDDSPRDCAPGS